MLRDRAPDLTETLFAKTLGLELSAKNLGPERLGEIGKYLFVDRSLVTRPDRDYEQRVFQAGESWIADFGEIRRTASFDEIPPFIDAVVKVIDSNGGTGFDYVIAYSLAYQMRAKSADYWPEQVEPLEKAIEKVLPSAGSYAAQVRSSLNPPTPDAMAAARVLRDRLVRRILRAARALRFDESRGLLAQVDDADLRRRVGPVIDFAEGAHALARKDLDRALEFASRLPSGIKRSLLYAGVASAANPAAGVEVLKSAGQGRRIPSR